MNHLFGLAMIGCTVVAACGGNLRPPDDVPPQFAGDWTGHVVVTIQPEITREYDTALSVVVDGKVATLEGICPDNSGSASPFGFDGVLVWSGNLACPPSWVLGCAVQLEYTDVRMQTTDDGSLSVTASGKAHRSPITDMSCSGFAPFTMTFAGTPSP